MEFKRRFIFNGSAVAFGGRLIRPNDIVLASDGASALTVVGGRCSWTPRNPGDLNFGPGFSMQSANSFAEGLVDDLNLAREVSYGRQPAELLTATTHVNAEVKGLSVGDIMFEPFEPRLTVKRVRASLTSKSPAASYEASIRVNDDTLIEGVSVAERKGDQIIEHLLAVELDRGFYQRHDTLAKVMTAVDQPDFARTYGHLFYMERLTTDRTAPVLKPRLIRTNGMIFCTIVTRLRWDGAPFPGAEIDHNTVKIPNFGRVHFGELILRAGSRRLTMIRLELGSPTAGDGGVGEVDTNGSWSM